ncbi:MAG TPA: hypothetical protein VE673_03730 [Pseudonocardiaceae bacterium]|nr:hypothetical protein [Pseudonocardiaceae bacterium]
MGERRLVVGVDGSPASFTALRCAGHWRTPGAWGPGCGGFAAGCRFW